MELAPYEDDNEGIAYERTETAYQKTLFMAYCELGPGRSTKLLRNFLLSKDEYSPTKETLDRWWHHFDWAGRALAWDEEQEELIRIENKRLIKEMRDRNAQIGKEGLMLAVDQIKRLIEQGEFNANAAVALLKAASLLEADSLYPRIMPTMDVGVKQTKDEQTVVIKTSWGNKRYTGGDT